MTDPTPLTDAQLVDIRAALDDPAVAWTESDRVIDALLATVDAERARADQAEAERDALQAELRTMKIAHQSLAAIARQNAKDLADFAEIMDPTTDEDGRALDASPTEGNPE